MTIADYDNWRSINGRALSRDGKYLAYGAMPAVGDGEVILRDNSTGKEVRLPVGMPPVRETNDDEGEEQGPPVPRGPRILFSPDSKWLAVTLFPTKASVAQAKKEKKKPEEMPKSGALLWELSTGKQQKWESIKTFSFPEDASNLIVLQKESKEAPPLRPAAGKEPRKVFGTDLVVHALTAEAWERIFPNVSEFTLADDGKHMAYATSAKEEETNGAFVVAAEPGAAPLALKTGKAKYSSLRWDEKNRHLAFVAGKEVWGWVRGGAAASQWVKPADGEQVSDKAGLAFARNGDRLFFSFAKAAKEPEKKTEEPATEEEKAVFEMWHWKDDRVQTIQKRRAEQERNRSYRAVFHLGTKTVVKLADETLQDVTPSEDGLLALGSDDRASRPRVEYDGRFADYYLVNALTGARNRILTDFSGQGLTLSPDARYAAYYDKKHWFLLNTASRATTNVSAALAEGTPKVHFHNELHDTPSAPPSYGQAGWTKDSKHFLFYDRYDVWALEAATGKLTNITEGTGRKLGIAFRVAPIRPNPRDRFLDPAQPLLLRAENEQTRESGIWQDALTGTQPPKQLLMEARNISAPEKARNADVFALTAERFDQAPDIFLTDASFSKLQKASNLAQQQESFAWGSSELVRYTNTDGVELQAMLVKSAGFDPAKKYPMLVYLYERLSNTVHNFRTPNPSNSINPALYASNGYVVLLPDITYTEGYPGESAMKCILPAVQRVVDMGFVNKDRVGIQGHSWGGYQIAYMVTRTNRFRAAAPGALVANMFSAYDGIRYGTGLPRQFQYEKTQSRIGGSIWQYPLRYLENSPLFMADRVQTPLLMMHNDADDAVPFTQGIEFYLALRRMQKEIYFFNYNGEPHNLRKRANRKDYSMRLFQFFNHYLKDEAAPEWMKTGIPYIEREKPEQQAMRPVSDAQQK